MGNNSSDFVCAAVTSVMKRVYGSLKQAAGMVFCDTTSHLDQTNTSLTVLLCGSPIGALPLGAIFPAIKARLLWLKVHGISFSKKTFINTQLSNNAHLSTGFRPLAAIAGNRAFNGNNDPAVFMTDDSMAEKNALSEVWPWLRLCVGLVLLANCYKIAGFARVIDYVWKHFTKIFCMEIFQLKVKKLPCWWLNFNFFSRPIAYIWWLFQVMFQLIPVLIQKFHKTVLLVFTSG